MVYVIKDTAHIYSFGKKKRHETTQEHLLFKLPPVYLKQIEKQRKLGENLTPGQWERVNPRGSPGGMVRLELTDTLN